MDSLSVPSTTEAAVGPDANVAYLAVENGFAIVDISDPEALSLIERRTGLLQDRKGGPLKEILDVKVDGNRLLVVGPANGHEEPSIEGALLYDVSDPRNPSRELFYETEYPIHNAYLKDDLVYLVDGDRLRIVKLEGGGTQVGM
ncbi:MAG: hypothetical protein ABEI52_09900, partial [Halobacteriaceae archaeon]